MYFQILTDWHLIGAVFALTGIVVFLLFLGDVIPPLRNDVFRDTDMEDSTGIDVSL